MRQELHMMRTSPRAMIGFGGNDAGASGTVSPEKTISDAAFSIDAPTHNYRNQESMKYSEPTPVNEKAPRVRGNMSPQGGSFFMTATDVPTEDRGGNQDDAQRTAMLLAIEAQKRRHGEELSPRSYDDGP